MKRKRLIVIIGLILFLLFMISVVYEYCYHPVKTSQLDCAQEQKYIAFVLGFDHDGECSSDVPAPVTEVVVKPGQANEALAEWVQDHAFCFAEIYTQRAISDIWLAKQELDHSHTDHPQEGDYALLKGTATKVYQMHRHNPQIDPVRTLEALCCAVARLGDKAKKPYIVLVAHDKHFWRSCHDLLDLYPSEFVLNPGLTDIPYPAKIGPFCWAIKNNLAHIRDFFLRCCPSKNCRLEVSLEGVE